ncbi:hypothetical protein ACU4GD_34570 [Cupriavidus basilensis]
MIVRGDGNLRNVRWTGTGVPDVAGSQARDRHLRGARRRGLRAPGRRRLAHRDARRQCSGRACRPGDRGSQRLRAELGSAPARAAHSRSDLSSGATPSLSSVSQARTVAGLPSMASRCRACGSTGTPRFDTTPVSIATTPSKASKSPAPPGARAASLPPAFVLTLTAMVGIGLALMFPRETLRERLLGEGRAVDGLSMAYLEAWSRAAPEETGFTAVLAEQHARVPAAWTRPKPCWPGWSAPRRQPARAARRARRRRCRATQPDPAHPYRDHAAARVCRVAVKRRSASSTSNGSPGCLTRHCRCNGGVPTWKSLPPLLARSMRSPAQHFYRALAKSDPARAELWSAQAASAALASGDYRQAADALFAAQALATDPAEQRRLFLAALKTLQSGNDLDKALARGRAARRQAAG